MSIAPDRTDRVVAFVVAIPSLACILLGIASPAQRNTMRWRPLLPAAAARQTPEMDGFAPGAVYTTTSRVRVPYSLPLFGSWMGSDHTTGHLVSQWYPASGSLCVMVAGYPGKEGNELAVDLDLGDGRSERTMWQGVSPGETWQPFTVPPPRSGAPVRIRITAKDGSRDACGWLGVSEPFGLLEGPWYEDASVLLRLILAFCLATACVLGPGLALRSARRNPARTVPGSLTWIALPGIGGLVASGSITWLLSSYAPPRWTSSILLAVTVLISAVVIARRRHSPLLTQAERRAMEVMIVLAFLTTCRAAWSPGYPGGLYDGTVSRTLETSPRSDSRISYHIVQLIAHGVAPHSHRAAAYFAPWDFSHRGALAGIACGALVLAAGSTVPAGMPEQSWQPFDPEGFMVYRIGMAVIGATVILTLFGAASAMFGNERAGLLAISLGALSPFLTHELVFTWPKLHAAAFVIGSMQCVHAGRPGLGGLLTGAAFLFHPSALVPAPFVCMWAFVRNYRRRLTEDRTCADAPPGARSSLDAFSRSALQSALFVIAFGAVLAGNAFVHGGHYEQAEFLLKARDHTGRASWIDHRVQTALCTLVPGYGFIVHGGQPSASLPGCNTPSPAWSRLMFQYWACLPMAFGAVGLPFLITGLVRAVRRFRLDVLIAVACPFVLFVLYWGTTLNGLMLEGMHPIFLALLLFIAGGITTVDRGHGEVRLSVWTRLALVLRVFEVAVIIFGTWFLFGSWRVPATYPRLDLVLFLLMIASTARLAYCVGRSLRDVSRTAGGVSAV